MSDPIRDFRSLALGAALAASVGCSGSTDSPTAPSPSSVAQAPVTVNVTRNATIPKAEPSDRPRQPGGASTTAISFPPRNEPNAFFQNLTALYRDVLRRTQTSPTYVDAEGENVWLTEYFRFYLNGCSHQEAVNRTISQIRSGGTQPVCGGETPTFPPRNLPNEFQTQLEATYRDFLRRPLILSYVDSEGANVWLAQYLRFRVGGCSHGEAESKVFAEIRGGGVQSDCAPLWSATGSNVSGIFIPATVARIRATAVWTGPSHTYTACSLDRSTGQSTFARVFSVTLGGPNTGIVVQSRFEGTYPVVGGDYTVNCFGVTWTFTEVR